MLIEFSVTNFRCFREKQTFTMCATKDNNLENANLIPFNSKKYAKIAVLYGANASGKTAFFDALDFVKSFINNSNYMMEKSLIPITPYAFDEKSKSSLSTFELVFVKNDIKYHYSFSCDRRAVYSERLDKYENGKPKLVFERTEKNHYKFNSFHELESVKDKNTDNKLFLCTAATWNIEVVKPVVEFLMNDLVVTTNIASSREDDDMISDIEQLIEQDSFDEYKKFCLRLLGIGDFSISDFDVKIETAEIDSMPEEFKTFINAVKALRLPSYFIGNELKRMRLTTVHKISDADGHHHDGLLSFTAESLGTRALFKLAPVLFDTLKHGKVLVVDEIDRSLHPLLVKYIVSLFVSEANKSNAQLICNTHDTNLLDLDLLRRDEIWFVERNPGNGVSEIYPLTDFSPRQNENIEKGYLLGRYGAIPFIRNGGNLWDD